MYLAFWTLVVLLTSFFCSLSEASLLSVSRARVEGLTKKSRSARVIAALKHNLARPIAAILILNTVANTGGAALAGREYERLFDGEHMGLFTVAFTAGVLVFSELVPKTLGVRNALGVSLLVARPLEVVIALLRPFTWLVERAGRWMGGDAVQTAVSVEDLRAVARMAASSKVLGREEHTIIEVASRMPKIKVSQVMIHREDIVALALSEEAEELLVHARRSMHSRLLLCRNDLSDVLGFVNVKEVLWRLVTEDGEVDDELVKRVLGESVRTALTVSADLDLTALIQRFSSEHEHIALVLDDAGEVAGMVTLEDVVEELIGEIDDEYDRSPQFLESTEANLWRMGGGTLWKEVADRLGLIAVDVAEDADLDGRFDLNDLAADRLRGKLRTGAVFSIGPWRFKVLRMRRGKVLHLEARRLGTSRAPSVHGRPADETSAPVVDAS